MTELRSVTRSALAVLLAVFLAMPAWAATTGTIAPFPKHAFYDANGNPCNGCKLFTYTSGTSTKVNTYTDAALSVANANPIVLDSAGRCTIFLTPGASYKFVLAPSTDTDPPAAAYWTVDTVSAVPPASTSADVDVTATAGENLAAGETACLSDGSGGGTAGRWYRCDADFSYLSSAAQAVGFATAAITTGASGTVRRDGRITGLSGLVAGTTYYVSATAGALTNVAPTNQRAIAVADSTTTAIIITGEPDATATLRGLISQQAQTLAGAKTFSSTAVLSIGATYASTSSILNFAYARCTSALTKNNNTTLADVTGLSFAIGANETWTFRYALHVSSGSTPDLKMALTGPAAPTAVAYSIIGSSGVGSVGGGTAFSTAVDVQTNSASPNVELIIVEGIVRNGANAGTVQLQAAQATANVSDTVVRAESTVMAFRTQ